MTERPAPKTINERIARYAYRYWMRHNMTEWPKVHRVAASLRIRHSAIEDCTGDGHYQLTGYNIENISLGNLRVEATIPEVERRWCEYWFPYSGGICSCGMHAPKTMRRPADSADDLTARFKAISGDCTKCAVRDANCCALAECPFLTICPIVDNADRPAETPP